MTLIRTAVLLIASSLWASAQLYLVTGSPNSTNGWYAASDLFEVVPAAVEPRLVAKLVSEKTGTEWIAANYDWGKIVLLPGGPNAEITVVDFHNPDKLKQCVGPVFFDSSLIEQRLADIPALGPSFVWFTFGNTNHVEAMKLDSAVPCSDSFADVGPGAMQYIVAHGKAGIAGQSYFEGPIAYLDKDNSVVKPMLGKIYFLGYSVPKQLTAGFEKAQIVVLANTAQVFALSFFRDGRSLRLAFRKRDQTWHKIPGSSDDNGSVRTFQEFITLIEAHFRTGPDSNKRTSAGESEWRSKSTAYGPSVKVRIEQWEATYPGRLHVYDLSRDRLLTIETRQADSEILLIDNKTVYYRIVDRLYAADITDTGVEGQRLIVKSDIVDDVHWAFRKR